MVTEVMKKFGFPDTLIKKYDYWSLLLRREQVTLGSIILINNENVDSFSKISSQAFYEYEKVIREIELVLSKLFNYDKINYLMLMMVDSEVHFHVIPRYSKVIKFNNFEFKDYGWPAVPKLANLNKLSSKTFSALRTKLEKSFNDQ